LEISPRLAFGSPGLLRKICPRGSPSARLSSLREISRLRALAATPWLGALLVLASCTTRELSDEMAKTLVASRPSTVRSGEALAKTAENLPATFEELNRILAEAANASRDARAAEGELVRGLARVVSSTAGALDRTSLLVASIDSGATAAAKVLDDARASAEETREDRTRIVRHLEAVSASVERLLSRADESTRAWDERAKEVRDHEARAAKALADLAEASARVAGGLATVTSAAGNAANGSEPDLEKASRSVAAILGDLAKVTGRLAADDGGRAAAAWAAVGGAAGAVALGLAALAVRSAFRKAVAARVEERLRRLE
jgi:hypothetical protein